MRDSRSLRYLFSLGYATARNERRGTGEVTERGRRSSGGAEEFEEVPRGGERKPVEEGDAGSEEDSSKHPRQAGAQRETARVFRYFCWRPERWGWELFTKQKKLKRNVREEVKVNTVLDVSFGMSGIN